MERAANKREIIYYKCIQYGKYIRILLKADVPAWNIKSILERGRRKKQVKSIHAFRRQPNHL